MNWWKDLKIRVKFKEPLKRHTTFKIGGPAQYFVEPKDTDELKALLDAARRYKIPVLVMGQGSNILASDRGVRGIVVRLSSPSFNKISVKGRHIIADSGARLNALLGEACKRGLSGLEFLSGIPGTLGGALAMNAGAWGSSISDLVEEVEIMSYNGIVRRLKNKDIRFGYRSSGLAGYIILRARLKLEKHASRDIISRMDSYRTYRLATQDILRPSAGCVFKNPKAAPAGRLIDLCGLKGRRSGGARISELHANFIINEKNASSQDVLKLIKLIKRRVKDRFDVVLEPEIKLWQ